MKRKADVYICDNCEIEVLMFNDVAGQYRNWFNLKREFHSALWEEEVIDLWFCSPKCLKDYINKVFINE